MAVTTFLSGSYPLEPKWLRTPHVHCYQLFFLFSFFRADASRISWEKLKISLVHNSEPATSNWHLVECLSRHVSVFDVPRGRPLEILYIITWCSICMPFVIPPSVSNIHPEIACLCSRSVTSKVTTVTNCIHRNFIKIAEKSNISVRQLVLRCIKTELSIWRLTSQHLQGLWFSQNPDFAACSWTRFPISTQSFH